MEYLVEAHDGDRFEVSALAQPGTEQRVPELLLRGSHRLEREPFPRLGDEVPVNTLVICESEGRLGALFRFQRVKKVRGGGGHLPARSANRPGCEQNKKWR